MCGKCLKYQYDKLPIGLACQAGRGIPVRRNNQAMPGSDDFLTKECCTASRCEASKACFRDLSDFWRIGAVAGTGTNLGMVAAGIGALLVNRTETSAAVEITAVAIGHTGEGEGRRAMMEVLNQTCFFQASGYEPEVTAFLAGGHQADTDKVRGLDLDRQTATGGHAVCTKFLLVFAPCRRFIRDDLDMPVLPAHGCSEKV